MKTIESELQMSEQGMLDSTVQGNKKQEPRQSKVSEVLLQRKTVGILLGTVTAIILLACNTSLCVFRNLFLEEVGL